MPNGSQDGRLARIRARLSQGRPARMLRYSAGSVVATAVSQVTFLALYALGAGPRVSSIVAFAAGMLPNYHLNRRWAWGREGRSSLTREVLPYLGVVLTSLAVVTAGTELAEGRITALGLGRTVEVVAVTVAFAAVNGVAFVGKYLIYDRWLFGRRAGREPDEGGGDGRDGDEDRSRSQVPTSTRA